MLNGDADLNLGSRLMKTSYLDECCFIIGNGPSLNKMDLSLLKDITCIGLNKIHMHPGIKTFGINYHVAVNPLVIEQSFDDFKSLNCPSFLSYRASLKQKIRQSPYNFIVTSGVPGFSSDILFSCFLRDVRLRMLPCS